VNQSANERIRGAALGLLTFVTLGVGLFIGAWISGQVVDTNRAIGPTGVVSHDWGSIWLVPAGPAAGILVLFAVLFRSSLPVRTPELATARSA
jgi:MFS family permease